MTGTEIPFDVPDSWAIGMSKPPLAAKRVVVSGRNEIAVYPKPGSDGLCEPGTAVTICATVKRDIELERVISVSAHASFAWGASKRRELNVVHDGQALAHEDVCELVESVLLAYPDMISCSVEWGHA